MNMFEQATRQSFRFTSIKGLISVEDLWQLPLQSKRGACLDAIAVALYDTIQSEPRVSFVVAPTATSTDSQIKLEIVKYIISVKQTENSIASTALATKQRKAKLMSVLANKKDAALESLTEEELQAQIAACN